MLTAKFHYPLIHDEIFFSALFQEDSTSIELINLMKKLEIYPFAWMISTAK